MTTSIEWTDVTWNPTVGCSRVSEGCTRCYAEKVAHRGMSPQHRGLTVLGKTGIRWLGVVRFLPERLDEPLRWRKPRRVFVNSMSDLFHEKLTNEQIAAVFGVMAAAPRHTFQVLTKRPERMRAWFAWAGGEIGSLRSDILWRMRRAAIMASPAPAHRALGNPDVHAGGIDWPLPNVWIGVSVEDQATADERIPILLETPAAIRWVSYEPALGPVDFERWIAPHTCCSGCGEVAEGDHDLCPSCLEDNAITTWGADQLERWESGERYAANDGAGHDDLERGPPLDWIVVGGESGPGARPFDIAWARSVIDQCHAANVPAFCKQLGSKPFYRSPIAPTAPEDDRLDVVLEDRKGGDMSEWDEDLRVRRFPEVRTGG